MAENTRSYVLEFADENHPEKIKIKITKNMKQKEYGNSLNLPGFTGANGEDMEH